MKPCKIIGQKTLYFVDLYIVRSCLGYQSYLVQFQTGFHIIVIVVVHIHCFKHYKIVRSADFHMFYVHYTYPLKSFDKCTVHCPFIFLFFKKRHKTTHPVSIIICSYFSFIRI